MRHILAQANQEVLLQFAWSNVLLAFDYDGTLAPIVPDPTNAQMRHTTRRLLEKVAQRYPCAVISGRAQHDALLWLDGIAFVDVLGNHGLEPWQNGAAFESEVSHWHTLLEKQLASYQGVIIENKRFSLAIHYRESREKKRALEAILKAGARLHAARIIKGKFVVNILPDDAPHKGMALQRLLTKHGCDTAIYIGDDETDEDVFSLDCPGQLLTILVGKRQNSEAAYFLKGQEEIDAVLRILLNAPRRLEQ